MRGKPGAYWPAAFIRVLHSLQYFGQVIFEPAFLNSAFFVFHSAAHFFWRSCVAVFESGAGLAASVAGGAWGVNGFPVIGEHGLGVLTVSGGGTVTDNGAFIGRFGDGEGHATVTGAGSTWTSSGPVTVAGSGRGTLTVQDGGLVTCAGGCMIAGNGGSDGAVAVSGATLAGGSLSVGSGGVGRLDVGPGGAVNSTDGAIAGIPTADGSAVTVGGANAGWTLSGELVVGDGGAGSLTIQDGGRVSDVHAVVGRFVSGRGTAVVTGAGSAWTGESLAVGYLSGTGSLSVQNGGRVTSQNGSIGNSSGPGTAVTVVHDAANHSGSAS